MPPDLPANYYHDNVLTLFAHVERVYADLLDGELLAFLECFAGLGPDAQKLYIRLLNRSHEWYRASKLNYPEIGALDAAIDELDARACIKVNPEVEFATLLSLFSKPEILAHAGQRGLDKLNRAALEDLLLEQDDDALFSALAGQDDLLQVLGRDQYQQCQMLFFGNLNQSMTDFVLRDLGLNQYEAYRIDPEHRPYRSQLEIQQHWLLHQLETLFELCDRQDGEFLCELYSLIPSDIDPLAPAFRKSEHLRYEIARQIERNGDLPGALERYRHCLLPPSRERIARIYAQQGRVRESLALCVEIIAQPIDEEETQFASQFSARLARRQGLAAPVTAAARRLDHQPETADLEIEFADSVELAVAEYFNRRDQTETCYFVENSLFNGVLGLLLWEVIFAPLTGAFFNPFQYRPSDFYAHDFCARRGELLEQAWSGIDDNAAIFEVVSERWPKKHGLMNPLVNWQDLDLGLIDLALERIEHAHWRAIFDRILLDLRHNRAGFPDLVHFPPAGGYNLIEVKGPGDNLQKNQLRWMQYFHARGIPHRLARVRWIEN